MVEKVDMQQLTNIAIGVLGYLSILLAFIGFICALYFAKEWSSMARMIFKITIIGLVLAFFVTVCLCLYLIEESLLQHIKIWVFKASYLLYFSVAIILGAVITITAFVIFRG